MPTWRERGKERKEGERTRKGEKKEMSDEVLVGRLSAIIGLSLLR
jgi:hypothetical protein